MSKYGIHHEVKWLLHAEENTEMVSTNTLVYWLLAWSRGAETHAFKHISVNGVILTKNNWKGHFMVMGITTEQEDHYTNAPKFDYI